MTGKPSLHAGVAKRDITPRKPMFLVGYPHVERISTGLHDPLWASAFYLGNGKREILLIALDIVYICAADARRCREAIHPACGVPAENILISGTHTHSGPNTRRMLMWERDPVVPPVDPEFVEYFRSQIIAAGVAARQSARAARLAIARAEVHGVGGNRLAKDGIMDHEIGIFYAKRADDGKPLGLAMVYGMHPTVLHEDSKLVTSDFPHYARVQIEEALPGVTVAYHNGPCGNLSPRYDVKGQTFAEAERLGRKLGQAVVAAIRALKESDFQTDLLLASRQTRVDLPTRRLPSVAETEANLARARANYERLKAENAGHGPVRTAECVIFGCEEAVMLAQAQVSGRIEKLLKQHLPVEVQVLRIGDTFIAGLPCELFVEYGLDIKRRAPGRAFVISLANGELQGYIVSPEAEAAGGYEAAFSLFTSEAGAVMTDAAIELMRAMAADQTQRSRGRKVAAATWPRHGRGLAARLPSSPKAPRRSKTKR